MKNNNLHKIEKAYAAIQSKFCLENGSIELSNATQFASNYQEPVHRWFRFKEGFASNLLMALHIDTTSLEHHDSIFLDPFCGSGTTILSGDIQHRWKALRIGLEINPFLKFVAETKANWRLYDPSRLSQLTNDILREPLQDTIDEALWPKLSTFYNSEIFLPDRLSQLIDVITRIKKIDQPEKNLLLLGAASAAEQVGFFRKDGRALRVLRKPEEIKNRLRIKVQDILRLIWMRYEDDLRSLDYLRNAKIGDFIIQCADGKLINFNNKFDISDNRIDLIAYSPPYFNHIDYTEVYKIELWLLGFISSSKEMLELRKRTLRSHASINRAADGRNLPKTITKIIEMISDEVEKTGKRWHRYFRGTAFGYFEDIQLSLEKQFKLLRPGRQVVCVIANSAHGSGEHRIPIASDLLFALLAENVGFSVEALKIARQMRRRDSINSYLRETVIIMKKPL